jgi:hypothetical protein
MAQSAIREGNWKLLRGGDREYLYDLATDREEKHNLAAKHPEIARRLRAKLKTWADGLTPPGMALGPMAATWNDYFDHYLEGKPAAKPTRQNRTRHRRHRRLARPQRQAHRQRRRFHPHSRQMPDKPAFITAVQLKLAGPVAARLTLKTAATGQGRHRLASSSDDKDFLPANRVTFPLQATTDWQTHTLEIPTTGRVIHVRVHLPAGGAEFREIELKAGKR